MPKAVDDYVHRIGRTGRVGNGGRATSFFDPNQDRGIAADLIKEHKFLLLTCRPTYRGRTTPEPIASRLSDILVLSIGKA
ncbi:GH24122 [Drosophila grimshawi]|uniref:GH24122 n=1 Tax=Drosophila grimshawi TaxID=7222 RepID=B4JNK5_DROGR|nr:GH24122 [Drosophila grimshawi]